MKTQEYHNHEEQIIDMLTPKVEVKPSANLRERILNAASQQATTKSRKSRLTYWIGAATSMAAVVAIAITFMLNTPAYAARKYFSTAIIAAQEAKTLIMKLSVRTAPDEPIDYINPSLDFIPATVKVIYGEPMLWSIEKKNGRKILYKGADAAGDYIYQWIGGKDGRTGWKSNHNGYSTDELEAMLDPRILLEAERRTATRNKGTDYEVLDLGELVIVRVSTTAQGDYSKSDYMLNTSLAEANTIREYSFSKQTGLLWKMRIIIPNDKQPITIVESESIDYNQPLSIDDLYDEEQFSNITFNNVYFEQGQSSPLTGITAEEAAKIILEAMGSWDNEILNTAMYYYKGDLMTQIESKYKGLQVQSIGKSFKSGLYAGRFVKCKVVLADGTKENLTLALRNDNKHKVWLLDGGI